MQMILTTYDQNEKETQIVSLEIIHVMNATKNSIAE